MAPAADTDYPYRINPKMQWTCSMPMGRGPLPEPVAGNPDSPPPRDFAFTLAHSDPIAFGIQDPSDEPMLADVGSGFDDLPAIGFHAAQRTPQIPAGIQEDNHSIRARLHAKAANQGTGHPALINGKNACWQSGWSWRCMS